MNIVFFLIVSFFIIISASVMLFCKKLKTAAVAFLAVNFFILLLFSFNNAWFFSGVLLLNILVFILLFKYFFVFGEKENKINIAHMIYSFVSGAALLGLVYFVVNINYVLKKNLDFEILEAFENMYIELPTSGFVLVFFVMIQMIAIMTLVKSGDFFLKKEEHVE